MYIGDNLEKYSGKLFSHFENGYGDKVNDLHMCEQVIIVFKDGSKIKLALDCYGQECYISQYKVEED